MPVAKCSCPACGATLRFAAPHQTGERILCPRCSNRFPLPEADETEGDAGRRPAEGSRPSWAAEDVIDGEVVEGGETAGRRPAQRQRRDRYDDEDTSEDGGRRRERRRDNRGLKTALILGGALLGVALVGVIGYVLLASLFESDEKKVTRSFQDAADVLSRVRDEVSAREAKPRLLTIGGQLRSAFEAVEFWNGEAWNKQQVGL